jgi:hypothetical protein
VKNLANHMYSSHLPRHVDAAPAPSSGLSATGGRESVLFESLLSSGGDERLAIEPRSGHSRYGIPSGLPKDEIWLSSSTASAVSERGHAAARRALELTTRESGARSLPAWFDDIRQRLLGLFAPPGGEIVLSASGTDTELLLLAVARTLMTRPLANLIVAPQETGRGVVLAADGRHFLGSAPFAAEVTRGTVLSGFESAERRVETVELRDHYGVPIDAEQVDRTVAARVDSLIADGGDVLLHLLDCSKTGRSGPTRELAKALAAAHPDRVLVAVDACQLRCSREQIRADLEAGFAVMLTGSKFAGGPPFSGALLLPPALASRMESLVLPKGLSAYTAALDWSPRLRENLRGEFSALANIGLGLRWECALAELEAYFALDADLRQRIAARFAQEIHTHLAASPYLKLADWEWRAGAAPRTIFPIMTFDDRGIALSAERLQRVLRTPAARPERVARLGRLARLGRAIHLGQPAPIGEMQALRVCLGAPQANAVADRLGQGHNFDYAFQPLADDLAELFCLWHELAAQHTA